MSDFYPPLQSGDLLLCAKHLFGAAKVAGIHRTEIDRTATDARANLARKLWATCLPKESWRLPACQTILNAIGNLLADRCQVEEFLFAEDIFGFFGKLPIHHRLVPKEIIPIHACHCAEDLS